MLIAQLWSKNDQEVRPKDNGHAPSPWRRKHSATIQSILEICHRQDARYQSAKKKQKYMPAVRLGMPCTAFSCLTTSHYILHNSPIRTTCTTASHPNFLMGLANNTV